MNCSQFSKSFVFLILIIFSLSNLHLSAQSPATSSNGSIIGIVCDSTTKVPLEFIVITVLTQKDSFAKGGGLTDNTGSFYITTLPDGNYFLRISFIGYETTFSKAFSIQDGNRFDAGKLLLSAEKHTMQAVDIIEDKSDFTNGVDKKVYEVAKNPTTAGGTATDVLQTIPSVTVDIDGNVSMRGS